MIQERIKAALKEQNISLRELSRRTGIEAAAICRYLNGQAKDMHFTNMVKIARELGLSLDELGKEICD